MKLLYAILAYLGFAVILGWGILAAVGGNFWVLAAGVLGFTLMVWRFGCTPVKGH